MHNVYDVILANGCICTLDRSQPRAEALAVADGALVAVGTTVDVLRHARPNTFHLQPLPPRVQHFVAPAACQGAKR